MNRKQWIIIGITITVLLAVGLTLLWINRSNDNSEIGENKPVFELVYCAENQVKPCVVSFGLDIDGNMLVNILLPDLTFPGFYLEIVRGGEVSVSYTCRRIPAKPNNAYCMGEKLPPGESLHLMIFSTRDDVLLAQGNLSIIGLAFPTLEIALPTDVPTDISTKTSQTPTSTEPPDFILPTHTQTISPTK
ncbi:MAG TPA: hypothetical protein VLA72_04725 [Anaerolineales bacterium]|nr:hypothetical protein [Anaerolineales bacterium]